MFADATEDHQWIHVDPERAASGPFGGTIAHGLLTLSLLPYFVQEMYRVDNVAMAINYGYNKVRFITPVPVDARVRARAVIDTITQLDGAVQAAVVTTVEVEGSEKPACRGRGDRPLPQMTAHQRRTNPTRSTWAPHVADHHVAVGSHRSAPQLQLWVDQRWRSTPALREFATKMRQNHSPRW